MVIRNKLYRLFDKYRKLIKSREKKGEYLGCVRRGNKTKNRILDFYLKNLRWPSRTSESKRERSLAQSFENCIAKQSGSYDAQFRRIVMTLGRKSNHKRKHNVKAFKQEILDFIEEHGRVPTTNSGEKIPGEGRLRSKLDYYTKTKHDMTLLGKVYDADKCHRSGIPVKFRPLLNGLLQENRLEEPLIRTV